MGAGSKSAVQGYSLPANLCHFCVNKSCSKLLSVNFLMQNKQVKK